MSDLPGAYREVLSHPNGKNDSIEMAIIMEHRFAFFYWMKWKRSVEKNKPLFKPAPTLVTIDWHQDLAWPSDSEKEELEQLDQENLSDVSNFVWAGLNQNNDGHILAGAYLNIIGDVVVLKHQGVENSNTYLDIFNNPHSISEFKDLNNFSKYILGINDKTIFFDIDLDYFFHGEGNHNELDSFDRYTDSEIQEIIDPNSPLFQFLFPKIQGLTIALEPHFCGGILNSCSIMKVIYNQLFDSRGKWKHL